MDETFAAALRQARQSRGLSQEALAELADLSTKAVGMLERGARRFPHLMTVDKLDRALGFSTEERGRFRRLAARGAASVVPSTSDAGPVWVIADQLPASRASFTGRTQHLDDLRHALTDGTAPAGSAVVITVRGMAGVGKTALAIEAAVACRAHFPDGVLSVNLRGFGSGTPLTPLQVISQLLRATGVPAESLPADETEATAALRTRLANRRVLLLLDNAQDVSQVTDLIPSSSGSAVVITSRNTLTTISARLHVQLEPMPAGDAVQLLTNAAGADRLGESAERIAELCGSLPLALSVAGAWLLRHPGTSAAELVRRLDDESRRLDLLGVDDLDVRVSLSLSVDQLTNSPATRDREAARAFVLLGLPTSVDFASESVAALLETTPARAGDLLEHLTDLHLLESPVPGRYHFHDLVRTFAHELAQELPRLDREAAFDRLLGFYLAVAWHSAEKAEPQASRTDWSGTPAAPAFPTFTTAEEGLRWIDAESPNYLAIINQAVRLGGRDETTAGLVIGLYSYFVMRGHLNDWLSAIDLVASGQIEGWTFAKLQADAAIAQAELAHYEESVARFGLARDAFEAIGDLRAVAITTNNKARLLVRMQRYTEALVLIEEGLVVHKQLDDPRALSAVYGTLADVQSELGNWDAVQVAAAAGTELYAAAGDLHGVANLRVESAWARICSGHPDGAIDDMLQSIADLEQLGSRSYVCDARWVLADSYRLLDQFEPAVEQAELALDIALDTDDLRREAQLRLCLGEALAELGEYDEGAANVEFALAFYQEHLPAAAATAEALLQKIRSRATV